MLTAFFGWIKGILERAVGLIAAFFAGFKYGSLREKNKATKKKLEAMKDAKKIHDRVERDPAYRKRVRDKYR